MKQPLNVTLSKTRDGKSDYLQIMSADVTSLNIVLVAPLIQIRDERVPRGKK